MVEYTLMLSAIVVFAMGILYAVVGRAVLDKESGREERTARQTFALWWFGFAGMTIAGAMRKFIASFGVTDIALHVSITHLSLFMLFAGLWGLMYYLLYVYTGKRRLMAPLAMFYGAFFILGIYVVTVRQPVMLEVGTWEVSVAYARELDALLQTALLMALIVPLVIGALLYLFLYFKVDQPLQKTRILLVGLALAVWFTSAGVAAFTPLSSWAYWPLASRVLAFTAAVIILYAFTGLERRHRPPTPAAPVPGAPSGN